jgi:hypothetical protein
LIGTFNWRYAGHPVSLTLAASFFSPPAGIPPASPTEQHDRAQRMAAVGLSNGERRLRSTSSSAACRCAGVGTQAVVGTARRHPLLDWAVREPQLHDHEDQQLVFGAGLFA